MTVQSIILSHEIVRRVHVILRNEPLTGKFSYTVFDAETGKKIKAKTQSDTFEKAAEAAAQDVLQAIADSAVESQGRLIKELIALKPEQ